MPRYANIEDLPITLREVLSPEAQERYLETYNQAWDKYSKADEDRQPETAAHSSAWAAVKKDFVKVDTDGKQRWYRRGEEPTVEEPGASNQGIWERIKSIF